MNYYTKFSETPAMILAGGLGTRLQNYFSGPKPLAPVNGKPFLAYLISYLEHQGLRNFIFCVGHKGQEVRNAIEPLEPKGCKFHFVFDCETNNEKALGPLYAIRNALHLVPELMWIINGDTLLKVDYKKMFSEFHNLSANSLIAVARTTGSKVTPNSKVKNAMVMDYSKTD